jgi:general secretion pathway protein J
MRAKALRARFVWTRAVQARTATGFTLIELLVGLSILALLSVMSWRGLDGILRSQAQLRERGQALASLQTALAQWTLDLDQAAESPYLNALAWDGRQLRIVRRAVGEEALVVVAWGLRPGGVNTGLSAGAPPATATPVWRRWQSPPVRDRTALLKAWAEAAQGLDDVNTAVTLVAAEAWALHMHQGAGWARPPLVGPGTPLLEPATAVRLRLQLPAHSGLQGELQLDWANPRQNRGRP